MSPHGLVLFAALALGATGKLLLPEFTLRIVLLAALVFPVCLMLYTREYPSFLGFALIMPISLVGAGIGVAIGGMLARRWRAHRDSD